MESIKEVGGDKKGLLRTPQNSNNWKVDRVLILEKIEELGKISISNLARQLPFSRSSVYYACRDFEFAGLIKTRMKFCKHGAEKWIYFLGKKKQKQSKSDEGLPENQEIKKEGIENERQLRVNEM